MKKLLIGLLPAALFAQTVITGNVLAPDGTAINGKYIIQLTRSTVQNLCTTHPQTITFRPAVVNLTSGGAIATSLYASPCLSLSAGTSPAPLFQLGVGAGSGATDTVTGTQFGAISVTAGTSPTPNQPVAYFIPQVQGLSRATQCFLQPINSNAATSGVSIEYTAQRITLQATTSLTSTDVYQWSWACVLPYSVTLYNITTNKEIYSGRWLVPASISAVDISTLDITQLPN